MFGWESMPWLIEMEIMSKEAEFSREFGRPMTPVEKGEAYASATKKVFDALMASRVQADMAMANLCESERRSASMSGPLTFALIAGAVALVVSLIVGM